MRILMNCWHQVNTWRQLEGDFSYWFLRKAILERVICVWQSTIFLTSASVPLH